MSALTVDKQRENSENVDRKDFTPSEAVKAWQEIEARKANQYTKVLRSESEQSKPLFQATKLTGMSTDTLSKAKQAVIASRLANMPVHRPKNKSANLPTLSQPEAAKTLNISPRIIRTVKEIERESPELALIKFNSINYCDFFQEYRHIEAGSVNLYLSDLPYNLFNDNRMPDLPNDNRIDLERLEAALDYLLSDNGQAVLFCNLDLLIRLKCEFGKHLVFKHHHILHKTLSMPGSQFYPLNDAEFLAVCYRTGAKISDLTFNAYNGEAGEPYSKRNYDLDGCKIRRQNKPKFNHNSNPNRHIKTVLSMQSKCNLDKSERAGIEHPFQKPLKLCRQLIRIYSNPDEMIIDGFAGSGSTLIAAEMEKRQYVGFEIDHKYYLEGLARLQRFKCQETLPF